MSEFRYCKSTQYNDNCTIAMANNIKELRVAFLLTPSQFAKRIGVDVAQLKRLEAQDRTLSEEWVEAVSRALGVDAGAVTSPSVDIDEVVAKAGLPPPPPETQLCPIGARFAIQAMVAKLGGLKMALELSEDDLATAVRNVASFTEEASDDDAPDKRFIRLSQSLQIAVLTILQSRGADPGPRLQRSMALAQDGALALLQAFSEIDQERFGQETE